MTTDSHKGFLHSRKGRKLRNTLVAYLYLLPALAIILTFGLWPVLYSVYVSLHKWNIRPRGSQCVGYWLAKIGLGPARAVERTDCMGLENYVTLLGIQDTPAVIKMILGLVGVPAEGIGMILGVDRFLDMCRTVINVTGDLAAAVVVSRGESAAPPSSDTWEAPESP